MGNKSPKKNSEEQKSNSSVLNLSLESKKEQNQDSLINDNISDIINELKNKVKIPIENEYLDSSEIILEGKEEEIKIKFLLENNEDENFINEGLFNKRNKTFVPKISIKNTPKPHLLEPNEYISPLKLSIKSFGNNQEWHKKPNSVLYDFQKNLIDCKSCNDEDSLDDFFLINAETERNTPNQEDLHDLLNCRKKMTIFRNSLNEKICKEFENILNSDNLFYNESNVINNQQKKTIFWNKYIKQQQLKDKNKDFAHSKRIHSVSFIKSFDSDDLVEEEDNKDNGLFILGILEKAANEKKGRNTVNA